ncbi:MAG: hypothetical protein FJ291_11430, partial [Planctomycetes bacterium]|nr:hypothetical protein [Planctomycetota bacterium]
MKPKTECALRVRTTRWESRLQAVFSHFLRLKAGLRAGLLVAAAVAAACPAAWGGAVEAPAEVLFAPGASGYVTSWLVAGPFGFLRDAQIDQDFLGGEAKAAPADGLPAEMPGRGAETPRPQGTGTSRPHWQAAAFDDPVMNFKERCLPLGKSAFYLAAVLVAKKDAELTLALTHTGQARAWLDGKEVIRSDKDPFGLGPKTVDHTFPVKAGQRALCLLKLGSDGRYLQFLVRLKAGAKAATADDVAVALPLKAGAKPNPEAFVLPSLSVGLTRDRFVQPGRATDLALAAAGGYPLCDGRVSATLAVQDAQGKPIQTLKPEPATLAALAATPAEMAWTPPKDSTSPLFKIAAQVRFEGKELGTLSKTVYAPSNITQWTADLHKRLLAANAAKKLERDALATVLLKVEKAILLQQGMDQRSYAADEVHRELETANDWLGRLDAGKTLPPIEPGVHELAYLAPQDDSPQPYFLHVPQAVKAGKPLPAIVY